jgi:hypothetical protein
MKSVTSRLDGLMHFSTNEVVTNKITVNSINLYYQPYTDQTLRDLSSQYEKITMKRLKL